MRNDKSNEKDEAASRNRYRLLVGVGFALTVTAAAVWLGWRDRLPEPVATHWGADLQPDGHMPFWVIFGVSVGGMVLALVALAVAGRSTTGNQRAMVAVTSYFVFGILLGATISTVLANLDAPDWQAAAPISVLDIVLLIGMGVGLGAVGFLLAGGWSEPEVGDTAAIRPSVGLATGATGVWTGSAGSWAFVALGVVLLIAGVVGGVLAGTWVAVVFLLVFATMVWLSAVRVTVNSTRVSIGLGWWAWPNIGMPLDGIDAAEFIDVDPMAFGGWGYRVTPGVRGYIIRRGPGIRLIRRDKADIVVTVDDAVRGAGLVNDLIARRNQDRGVD